MDNKTLVEEHSKRETEKYREESSQRSRHADMLDTKRGITGGVPPSSPVPH